jgi:reverse gyrase
VDKTISNQKVSVIMKNNIEYDSITKKIKKCPICFNEEFNEDDSYCKTCEASTVFNVRNILKIYIEIQEENKKDILF